LIEEYREETPSGLQGTIIDIETIGRFDQRYRFTNDAREYQYVQPVIFGFIDRFCLRILYVCRRSEITELSERVSVVLATLPRPFYAFNASFEEAVLFHNLGEEWRFDGELQAARFESKAEAVRKLGIPNYGDPFYDKGILCMYAWENGEFRKAVSHNRACLLKERDILLMRGFREPDELVFVR